MDALALTDTNGLYGVVWFLGAARAAGLRPIVGAEAQYGPDRAVVLVRDREGYAGLCRLLTRIHRALNAPVREDGGTGRGSPAEECGANDPRGDGGNTVGGDDLPPVRIASPSQPRTKHAPDPGFSLADALADLPSGVVILSPCPNLLDALARRRG